MIAGQRLTLEEFAYRVMWLSHFAYRRYAEPEAVEGDYLRTINTCMANSLPHRVSNQYSWWRVVEAWYAMDLLRHEKVGT